MKQIHSTTIYCSICLLYTLKPIFVVAVVLEQEDPIQGLLDDWTFHSSTPLLTRMTNCLHSTLFPEFHLHDYSTVWLAFKKNSLTAAYDNNLQLSPINNLTALRDSYGRTKTFWETPRIMSLAEKDSRPKPPGTGSRSLLGIYVSDRGLHGSERTCCHAGPLKSKTGHGLPRAAQILSGISEETTIC